MHHYQPVNTHEDDDTHVVAYLRGENNTLGIIGPRQVVNDALAGNRCYGRYYAWSNLALGTLTGLMTLAMLVKFINHPHHDDRQSTHLRVLAAIGFVGVASARMLINAYHARSHLLSCCSGLFGSNRTEAHPNPHQESNGAFVFNRVRTV